MSIKQKTVTISGEEFLLTSLPATRGLAYLKQLSKLIGPSFSALSKEGGTVSDALEALFENMDSVAVEDLVKNLVTQGATKGSVSISFDNEFSGEYDKLFELVKAVVEHNYSSVFSLLGGSVDQ
ncbi:hypothetical protein D3C86_1526260 [compost metagenome]